jgi:tRNA-specific 2-thiouridylase
MPESIKVVVAMSGGVDSSIAAALLKKDGYEVIGIMLRLWSEPGKEIDNRCCTPDAMAIARRVASRLGIPFYVIDAQEKFYNVVVQPFIYGYAQCVTPNPCALCNQYIRWDYLLNHTLNMGAQFLATGHYARLRNAENGIVQLRCAIDQAKDQSYVLSRLNQFQLTHSLFPIGHLSKAEVRALAEQLNLPAASIPDSQDLCFLGNSSYREFLLRHLPSTRNPGPIMSKHGEILGIHDGLAFYTIGQRKGLNLSSPVPLYVLDKDSLHNALIVGQACDLGQLKLTAREVNWISGRSPEFPLRCQVKIRYRAKSEWAEIHPLLDDSLSIIFDAPRRDITPGQVAVIYQDDICLGSGIIS